MKRLALVLAMVGAACSPMPGLLGGQCMPPACSPADAGCDAAAPGGRCTVPDQVCRVCSGGANEGVYQCASYADGGSSWNIVACAL